jgi:phosphinothricin acetyltransferase
MAMSEGLEIRGASADDMAAVREIFAHHVTHGTASWELEPPDLAEMKSRRARLTGAGLPFVVGLLDGRIAGYGYASPYRPRPGYRFVVEDSVYLHPELTGRGLGRPLLQRVIDDCTAMGKRQMLAVIGDAENLPSIRLHQRLGFKRVALLEKIGWKFGRWLDSVVMQRALGEGGESPPER